MEFTEFGQNVYNNILTQINDINARNNQFMGEEQPSQETANESVTVDIDGDETPPHAEPPQGDPPSFGEIKRFQRIIRKLASKSTSDDAKIKELQTRLSKNPAERDRLQRRIDALNRNVQDRDARRQTLETKLQKTSADNTLFKNTATTVSKIALELRARIEGMEGELRELRNRPDTTAETQGRINSLELQLEKARSKADRETVRRITNSAFDRVVNADLKNTAATERAQRQQIQQRLENLRNRIMLVMNRYTTPDTRVTLDDMESRLAEFDARLAGHVREYQNLATELRRLQDSPGRRRKAPRRGDEMPPGPSNYVPDTEPSQAPETAAPPGNSSGAPVAPGFDGRTVNRAMRAGRVPGLASRARPFRSGDDFRRDSQQYRRQDAEERQTRGRKDDLDRRRGMWERDPVTGRLARSVHWGSAP